LLLLFSIPISMKGTERQSALEANMRYSSILNGFNLTTSNSFNSSGPITIYLGESVIENEFYQMISLDLKAVLQHATIENDTCSLKNDSIVIGRPAINKITAKMVADGNLSLQMNNWPINSYYIGNSFYNHTNVIIIAGKDNLGDGYGIYYFIEYLLKLHPEKIQGINISRSTNLIFRRMGIDWTYQLHFKDNPPYVSQSNIDLTFNNLKTQIKFALKRGINMLDMGDFLHCLTFDNLEPGNPYSIYAVDSPFRLRHEKYREIWQNFTNYIKQFNFSTIIGTDMVPYTPAIFEYLGGRLEVNNPKLWAVINASVFELFSQLNVDGLQIRIGEGGEVGSGNYTSKVLFRSIESTKYLISELLSFIDSYNQKYGTHKFLLFRTWTIGIGSVGDLHIDPTIYHQVFDEFDNRTNLVVSIKHVAMDFFQYVPRNPTIGIGKLPVIVEFQTAREYEGYGNYPNYLARSYQADLQAFSRFSNFKGVWLWTGYAGWYKGKDTSYGFQGFYAWQDANVYAYTRLNWNFSENIIEITKDWIRLTLGNDPKLISNFTQMLLDSEYAVRLGLYIHDFAKYTLALNTPFFSIGRLPTMLWVYWGIPTGSHAVLSVIYGRCRENLSGNIQEGFIALNIVENMISLIQGFETSVIAPKLYSMMLFSLEYQKKIYTMLAWYRQLFLCYYDYTTTLNQTSQALYLAALPQVKAAIANYKANWDSYENFSRYETYEMEAFIQRVEGNYPLVLTLARILFSILLIFIVFCLVLSYYYKRIKNQALPNSLKRIIEGCIVFKQSVFNPRQHFTNLQEDEFTGKQIHFYSFTPLFGMVPIIAFAFAAFNYLEYFDLLFPLFFGTLFLGWLYFSGIFYLIGLLFKSKAGFLRTLQYTQYLFVPIFIFTIALFGVYSIFGPELVWFYLVRSLIYSPPLIIALILLGILISWLVIIGLIGIIKTQVKWWKAPIMLFIPILILLPIVYYILDSYFADLIVFLNGYFNIINSVFNAAETSASQFF